MLAVSALADSSASWLSRSAMEADVEDSAALDVAQLVGPGDQQLPDRNPQRGNLCREQWEGVRHAPGVGDRVGQRDGGDHREGCQRGDSGTGPSQAQPGAASTVTRVEPATGIDGETHETSQG